MTHSYKKLVQNILGLLIIVAAAQLMFCSKAAAINNTAITVQAPSQSSANVTGTNVNMTPWLAVGSGDYNGPYTYAKIYAKPNGHAVKVTITLAPCTTTLGNPIVDYNLYRINPDGTAGQAVPGFHKSSNTTSSGGDCKGNSIYESNILVSRTFAEVPSGDTLSQWQIISTGNNPNPADQGWITYMLVAHLTGCNGTASSCADNEQSFRASVNSDSLNHVIGLAQPLYGTVGCQPAVSTGRSRCDPNDPNSYAGLYARDMGSTVCRPNHPDPNSKCSVAGQGPDKWTSDIGSNWDYAIQFAPDCAFGPGDRDSHNNSKVWVYDIDWKYSSSGHPPIFTQPTLEMDLNKDSRTSATYNWQPTVNSPKTTFNYDSNQYDSIQFGPSLGKRYQIVFKDINWQNTIQVYMPFDQFNAQQSTCTVPITCSVDAPPDGTTIPANQSYHINVSGDLGSTSGSWGTGPGQGKYYVSRISATDNPAPPTPGAVPQEPDTAILAGNPAGPDYIDTVTPPIGTTSADYTYSVMNSSGNKVGNTCSVSVQVTVPLNFYCSVSIKDVEPGQNDSHLYKVDVKAWGSGTGSYTVTLTPSGGAVLTSASTQPLNITTPPGGTSQSNPGINPIFYFAGYLVYTGSASATITGPGTNVPCTGSGQAIPASRPFFDVRQGDISTGGGFEDSSGNCAPGDSNYPGYVTPAPSNYTGSPAYKGYESGGIRAFAIPGSNKGASSDFGVDALGRIYDNTSAYFDFYSQVSSSPDPLFANTTASPYMPNSFGGYLNSNSQAHCVTDFFDTTKTSNITTLSSASFDVTTFATGQYQHTGNVTITTNPGNTIAAGKQVTVYIDGDVLITNNIKNTLTWDSTDPRNVPYLTIVARGNITVGPNVTQLDGLFIAQPTGTPRTNPAKGNNTANGIFYTCDPTILCAKQLVVNGAVIAQQVQLNRAHGTLGGPAGFTDSDNLTTYPAEIFNYSPAMVMGVPNFAQCQGGSCNLEGLFSLPPVF